MKINDLFYFYAPSSPQQRKENRAQPWASPTGPSAYAKENIIRVAESSALEFGDVEVNNRIWSLAQECLDGNKTFPAQKQT